jgi:hypothetical protein
MNYADNDEIYNEIVRIGQGKFTAEQIYQIAYMVICARTFKAVTRLSLRQPVRLQHKPKRYRRER